MRFLESAVMSRSKRVAVGLSNLNRRFALSATIVICLTGAVEGRIPKGVLDLPASTQQGTPKQYFTPEHIAKLRAVTAAKSSPDGSQVAYLLRVPRDLVEEDDGLPYSELHVIGRNKTYRPFVIGKVDVADIQWAPDGSGISFLTKRGDDKFKSIYLIAEQGGEARRIVCHEADISSYTWCNDGNRIAFLATSKTPTAKEARNKKGFNQEIYEEENQPVEVWVVDTSDPTAKPRPLNLPGSAVRAVWNPASDTLAVALAPSSTVDDEMMFSRVHIVDVNDGKNLAKVENPGKLGSIAWSPDGKHFAMISAADLHDPSAGRLMVVPATGGKPVDILPGLMAEVRSIEWQDNQTVMFIVDDGVWSTFGEVARDGSTVKYHIPVGKAVLSSFSLSRDGQCAAMIGEAPTHPGEVFMTCHGDDGPKRLTDSNSWLKDMFFTNQEPIRFKARDGLELEGILTYPVALKSAGTATEPQKSPLILFVHGGPEAHDRNGWLTSISSPGQVAAARGFAVFNVNYRGSTGRGVEFSKLGQGDPAGKEFDDLIDAVDHLVNMGLVDKNRVGVTGGSYGGYASAWCATKFTDRFAAAVMNVGVGNLISAEGATDIPQEAVLVHSRKHLWEDWMFFLQRSPIYYAEQARTPILIMHGKDDPRVTRTQSMEMYRHLKLHGKAPVRLVFYPGEGHGNRRAASRYDYHLRMLQWFEHYLKGPGGAPPPYELEYGIPMSPAANGGGQNTP